MLCALGVAVSRLDMAGLTIQSIAAIAAAVAAGAAFMSARESANTANRLSIQEQIDRVEEVRAMVDRFQREASVGSTDAVERQNEIAVKLPPVESRVRERLYDTRKFIQPGMGTPEAAKAALSELDSVLERLYGSPRPLARRLRERRR